MATGPNTPPQNVIDQLAGMIRKLNARLQRTEADLAQMAGAYQQFAQACQDQPRSITQEIDAIPGRRIFFNLVGGQAFTAAQAGLRAAAISFLISQDGPFIATHYPLVIWKPTTPEGATNFGQWSPVASWPLPAQQNADQDRIDLSYEVVDSGSQRNFQNSAAPPIFSRPDNLVPLPVPTMFAPNSTIQFYPTYEDILFNASAEVATTAGLLVVAWPGYKIVNL